MNARPRMTAEHLLTMPEEPGKEYELVGGELVEVSPASVLHNNKVREYLDAGCGMVWIVWPDHHELTVYTADGELDGGDVLPGFRVRVATLFEVG